MKRKALSWLLVLCLIVGLLPTAALAAEDGVGGDAPVVCAELDGCTGDDHAEGCPLYVAPEPADGSETPEEPPVEETEDPASVVSAVTALQERINALPDADTLEEMDEDEQAEVYAEVCAISDAIDKLIDEEAEALDVSALEEAAAFFTRQIMPLDEGDDTTGQEGTQENPWNISAEGEGNNVTAYLTVNNNDTDNPTYTLTISGSGAMKDFKYSKDKETSKFGSDAPWYTNLTRDTSTKMFPITELVIGSEVTYIGSGAFASLSITTVSFASSVTGYGKYVFIDCALSETVDWSGFTPTAIPEGLLYGNSNLVNSKIDGTTYESKIVVPV